ncbi:MAG: alpha/beta fold hydrolase, partial [Mycobacterium sp.]|nr:alpha/beta fold hydrolase [Mycobacterium sp.]
MDVTYDATKRELSTDQGTIRYHEAGDPSAPPLVLLHGSGPGVTGWRNYRGNLGFFAQTHHCYVIEFPGFGVSDPVEGHPVLTAGSSVIRFMDALDIESAPMIGNSMGGVVGVNLAIKKPDRVEKLVTIGGVGPN